MTTWDLPRVVGLRCKGIALAVGALAVLGIAVPAGSQAHVPPTGAVADHIEEDSVVHTPAKERRLERRTARITAPDVAVAQRRAPGDPDQVGQWGSVVDWPVVGVHVALLTNGKVVAYDSVGDRATETYPTHNFTRATVWDPQTGLQTPATVATGFNIFCSGLAHLMDGTLYTAGGNKDSSLNGIRQTHMFNQSSNTWTRGADMASDRWYPTVTPLRDGEMLITEGGPDVPEVRQTNGTIRRLTGASLNQPLYPWMDVAPDGRAFYSGPDNRMASLNPSGTGAWQMHGARDGADRNYGSHAMYDIGKILVSGGGNSLRTASTINLNGATPQVSTTSSMATGRRQHNLTVLADGTVLATGGNSSGASLVDVNNGVYTAELWNPATGTWRTLAAEQVTRQYHSTALLLPDGRVLSSGGGICGACDSQGYLGKNAQVFSPPYLFQKDGSGALAPRPVITSAPDSVSYNAAFTINTPAAASIGKVALVRLGAVTHSVNMEQRYVPLSFTAGTGDLTATAPLNANIAPPGYYMLFVIGTDGVPSVSTMVRIENDTSPPAAPSLTDTDPDSPANDNNPEVKGSAEAGSTVKIYSTSGCTGTPLATGTAAAFNGTGITTPVPGDQTTNLRATATDGASNVSGCSSALAYTEDSSPPGTPSLTDTDPDSPANDNNPEVKGSAEAGSTVKIYSTSGCTGTPLATGTAAAFNGTGITTPVPGDQTTNLRATATDGASNVSGCSSALAYTEDSSPPGTPSLTDTDPDSPANDNNPEVKGSAEAGSTVKIYSTSGCTGTPLATGSAATFNGAGITTPVPGDQTTSLRATATDALNNVSGCSAALPYTEDSTAPQTQVDSGPQGPTNDSTPTFGFSATGGAQSYECRFDSASFGPCSGPGETHTPASQLADGAHLFEVRATDSAQNTDLTPASRSFSVDTSAPGTPSITDTDPDSPANDNNPEVKGSAEAGSTVKIYSTSDCSGTPLASGSAATFSGTGITAPVPQNQTTNLRATATDAANNVSGCSASLPYTADSSPPSPPSLTDTDPDSPANDNNPEVKGSAEAGSTVKIYSNADCTGTPLATGSAATFNGAGITTPVPGDQTTNLRATATDAVNGTSGCSTALAYTEDSTAPQTQVDSGPQGPTNDSTPTFGFSATGGAQSYECRFDSASFGPCSGPGDTHTASALPDGSHTFEVRATDSAQNTDQTPATRTFTVDTAAPQTQVDSGPQGPTNDSTPTFGFSATGGAQSYECRFDSASFGPCSGPGETHTAPSPLSDGAHLFEVRSTDSAQNTDLTPASRSFTVDTGAPNTSITSGPEGQTSDNDPSFNLSSSEANSSFECRLDGPGAATGTFSVCASPKSYTDLADGAYTLQVRATDQAQNTDQSPATRSFTVDTFAPAAPSITDTDPDSPANDNNPEVKGSAEAGSTVKIYSTSGCTGTPLATGSAATFNGAGITTPVPGDQTTNLRATATDAVNGTSGCSTALAYTEDSTAPATSITSGPGGPTSNNDPSFNLSSSEANSTFECRLDGPGAATGTFSSCASPKSYTDLADGVYTLQVRATDSAQNTDGSAATRTFTVDTAAPQTQVDSGPQGPTSTNDPSFSFSSSESNSTFECRLDGPGSATGTFSSCSTPKSYTDLADGAYTIQVRATDSVQNTDGSAATRNFTVDTQAPSLSISSGPTGLTNNASPSFGFGAEGGSSVQCSIDQGSASFGACSSSSSHTPSSPLTDGSYTFRVRATDAAGNPATQTRNFTVDSAAPNTSITSGPQGPTSNNDPSFNLSSSEANSSFECRLDGPGSATGTFSSCSTPKSYTDLADGAYTLQVRATDSAQNTDQTPATRTFTVDTAAPQTQVDSGPQGPTNDSTPTFGFSATGGAQSYECRFDSASFGPCSGPGDTHTASALPDGSHTFEVRATDSAQNTDQTPATRTFTVDTAAPQTQVDSGPQGPTNDSTPTFGFSATGGAQSYECRFDSASFGPCSGPGETHTAPSPLSDGAHLFEVRATDSAQNTDLTPASRSFSVDTSAPGTPSITDTDPDSPANDNNPEVKGSAEAGSTVKIYSNSDCSGAPIATGPAAALSGAGITTPVPGDQTTSLRATTTDGASNTSACSSPLAYTEDSTAPQTQVDSGPQGSTNDSTPTFGFSATGGAQSYECRFDSASFGPCSGPGETHTPASQLADGAHLFEVRATDSAQNTDLTPASRSFSVDTGAPEPPSLTDTDPNSPANDNNPKVKGSAEAGSTVKIYSNADCTGTPLATGTAAAFNGAGITTPVPGDQTTNLRASATDSLNNVSGCSAALPYTEDSTPPETELTKAPPSETTRRKIKLAFSSTEAQSTFRCSLDKATLKPCKSPMTKRAARGSHVFRVEALDASGNADPTPAKVKFKVVAGR